MARMDQIKAAVAAAVQESLDPNGDFGSLVYERVGGLTIEHHDISATETQLRVTGEGMPGMPRYFLVKVSEQL